MRETRTEVIGRYRYAITQLGATQGRKVYRRLLSLVGSAAEGLGGSGEGAALRALGKLVQGLSDEDLDFFCDTFSPMTAVSGGEFKGSPQLDQIFEEHFAGRMVDLTKWLLACFRVNFPDFFALLSSGLAAGESTQNAAQASISLAAPIGSSGAS
jgi:hypothetical protein